MGVAEIVIWIDSRVNVTLLSFIICCLAVGRLPDYATCSVIAG